MAAGDALAPFRRITVKIGSALLVDGSTGRLRLDWLKSVAADVDALRRELRALAATRLRQAMAEGLEASDASHPSQWFPLIDALAASRRDELGTGGA